MMDDSKKLAFITMMTKHGLDHMKETPNEPTQDGKMSHDKKMQFIQGMTKQGVQHFGIGGIVSGLLGATNNFSAANAPTSDQLNNAAAGVGGAIQQQQGFATQAAGQNGFGNQSDVYNQQQSLANQLQAQSQGAGPNPAQAALNQNTGQNIAQQAALMAGQRGAGANAGLAARQAAQQGAATQQAATGQAATLQAQQQLAAESALQQQQAQLQGVAQNQIGTQGASINNLTAANLQNQGQLQSANNAANTINAGVASQNAATNQSLGLGALSGLSSLAGPLLGGAAGGGGGAGGALAGGAGDSGGLANLAGFALAYKGGEIGHDHISQLYYPKKTPMTLKDGGPVPGSSPIPHDDIKNDTVPAMLSKGEEVIDLDTLNDPGPIGKMARMVAAHINKKKAGKK